MQVRGPQVREADVWLDDLSSKSAVEVLLEGDPWLFRRVEEAQRQATDMVTAGHLATGADYWDKVYELVRDPSWPEPGVYYLVPEEGWTH